MRGRQFVAWMILVAFILLMCSACHSVEDAVKDTTGEVQTTDAADVSGSAGETEGEIGTDVTAVQEEPEELVTAQTFMLNGDIPFTVSDSELYTEKMILKAAEVVQEEISDGLISITYDEAKNESLTRAFEQQLFPEGYELPDSGVIVLSSLVNESVSERVYKEYFENRYEEILSVDSGLKEAVVSYLQAKFSGYNEEYVEEISNVVISDQAKKEGDAWMAAFREAEKKISTGFVRVESEPVITYVTKLDGNWLVVVRENVRIQYSEKDVMGSAECRLLVFRSTETGYELLHDYAREWYPDSQWEGIEEYLSDKQPVEKVTLLTYDEEQQRWQYALWPSLDRDQISPSEEAVVEKVVGLSVLTMEIPVGFEGIQDGEPVIVNGQEDLRKYGELIGLENALAWNMMLSWYEAKTDSEETVILLSYTDEMTEYVYTAMALLGAKGEEISLEVRRLLHEDAQQQQRRVRQLIVLFVDQARLGAVTKIKTESVDVVYSDEFASSNDYSGGKIGHKTLAVHEADLDHDGSMEQVELFYQGPSTSQMHVGICKDSEWIWYKSYYMYSDGGPQGVFLYRKEGKDYLVEYGTGLLEFGKYFSEYSVYSLMEDGTLIKTEGDRIGLNTIYYDSKRFPLSPDGTQDYVDRLNEILRNSVCVWGNLTHTVYWAPAGTEPGSDPYYQEDLAALFDENGDYTGCETIAEKTEVFNQYMSNLWFEDGQTPQMPQEFETLIEELALETLSEMKLAEALRREERSVWFKDYNGQKLQIVDSGVLVSEPQMFTGKIYYRADAGETPEQAAEQMVEAMLEYLSEQSKGAKTKITRYLIGQQTLTSWSDMVEELTSLCWTDLLRENHGIGENPIGFAREWMDSRVKGYGYQMIPLGDEMWSFLPDGYYRCENNTSGEFLLDGNYGMVKLGMISLSYSKPKPEFVLVKYGDVYCMQKATAWGV